MLEYHFVNLTNISFCQKNSESFGQVTVLILFHYTIHFSRINTRLFVRIFGTEVTNSIGDKGQRAHQAMQLQERYFCSFTSKVVNRFLLDSFCNVHYFWVERSTNCTKNFYLWRVFIKLLVAFHQSLADLYLGKGLVGQLSCSELS